jgi:hypothetical protein
MKLFTALVYQPAFSTEVKYLLERLVTYHLRV